MKISKSVTFVYKQVYKCYLFLIVSDVELLVNKAGRRLQAYIDELSHCHIDPVKVSQFLYSEKCISEATLDEMETMEGILDEKKTTLLSAIHIEVSSDYKKLKLLARVLFKFEETKDLSKRITNEYG